ncbi:MAG: pyruvate kinase [Nanoarchaeota archaeon]|nr:pyruvate kinase [Nanoarchaeota archaeon]
MLANNNKDSVSNNLVKKTKIIATLGPSSDSVAVIKKLYKEGMNVARLNFSHGSYEYFEQLINNVRKVSDEITILLDTKGPEIRTSPIDSQNDLELKLNQKINLSNDISKLTTSSLIQLDYKHLFEVKPKNMVFIDDGSIGIEVISVSSKDKIVQGVVRIPGKLGSKKTVSIHGHNVNIPFLSKKDKEDIKFGIKQGVDVVAASFVRKEKDVIELEKFLEDNGGRGIKIISKIEHGEALENISGIIDRSFGIMVARGDLGVEAPIEKVPFIQERLVAMCNEFGKPVIVATQMLESMKSSKVPTRAEVNDVAQAILQGADCVMLSGETANGKYPEFAVSMMCKICREYDPLVEGYVADSMNDSSKDSKGNELSVVRKNQKEASLFVTKSAYYAARDLQAQAILVPTESGFSARKISRFKPKCDILAVTKDMRVFRQLQMSWGVRPFIHTSEYENHDGMINVLVQELVTKKVLDKKRRVVIASGKVVNKKGHTNTLEIYRVEDILSRS